jgi:hypothetical protein
VSTWRRFAAGDNRTAVVLRNTQLGDFEPADPVAPAENSAYGQPVPPTQRMYHLVRHGLTETHLSLKAASVEHGLCSAEPPPA